ncbi:MAG: recombinase family protein [Anaerolineae bacterium]|nr:recombinase family protein [Anaerolineae bacterium]
MPPKPPVERTVALCYVRLSMTKDASDLTSPERQRANILRACEKYGWTPEWYEDAKGHKSATKEENRPAWVALKTRLTDPDVVAIVVNEQSRAMRNAWRAIKLFEELPNYGVKLHLATIDRTIDISTPDGRMTAYFQAFMDDLYALDASRRAQDSVAHRKRKGESIGIPPFGTVRNEEGFLTPTPYGTWFLPDGSFRPGKQGEEAPHPEAVWRGYYECAHLILELYRKNLHGYGWIAEELNRQGWAFRDRWNNPRPLTLDDVRRVTSAWREYAGLVLQGKARNRIAAKIDDPTGVLFDTGRAVFELDLLRSVAQAQESRSVLRRPEGMVYIAHIFPLADLLFCAQCEQETGSDIGSHRSRLIGHQKRKQALRYRHSARRRCGCQNQSVLADEVEGDFRRLVDELQVHSDAADLMAELAIQSQFGGFTDEDDHKLDEQRTVAIAKHRRALKNNLMLFQNGEIEGEEYYRQKDYHERQIAYWEARTTDKQRIKLELTTCMGIVRRLKEFWDYTSGEDRKLLAHSLFDEIIYDLDLKRIVDFKIKNWAEPFLVLRAALYLDEMGEELKNRFNSGLSSGGTSDSPNGASTPRIIIPSDDRMAA